jgi:HD superfamily phosphohydrolase YqeK
MNALEFFEDDIRDIDHPGIRELVKKVLQKAHREEPYFFKAQASRTGKYHPACCNVTSGLLRHVRRATEIARHLIRAYELNQRKADIVLAAVILHDIKKQQFKTHATAAGDMIMAVVRENKNFLTWIGVESLVEIVNCIRYHMGPWTERPHKKPMEAFTISEMIVYISDYLSSRPGIAMEIDGCTLPNIHEPLGKIV